MAGSGALLVTLLQLTVGARAALHNYHSERFESFQDAWVLKGGQEPMQGSTQEVRADIHAQQTSRCSTAFGDESCTSVVCQAYAREA